MSTPSNGLPQAFAHIDHLVEQARHASEEARLLGQVGAMAQKARLLRDAATDPEEVQQAQDLVDSIEAMPERFAHSRALHDAIRRRDLRRWPRLLDQGAGIVKDDPWVASILLGRLCDLRFGVRATPYAEGARVLDAFMEHLVERQVPFPASSSVTVLSLVNEPDLGAQARRHLLGWVRRLPIPEPSLRGLVAAEHGFVLQTLDERPDPGFEDALFTAWVEQGVTAQVVLPADRLDGDPVRLDLRGRFPNGHLRVTHSKRLATTGRPAPRFDATFTTPVAWSANVAQTLAVADLWFAHQVREVGAMGLTATQQALCVTLWDQKVEHYRLRQVLDEQPSPPPRSRPRL